MAQAAVANDNSGNSRPKGPRIMEATILQARAILGKALGMMFAGKRDLYETFGYQPDVTYEEMLQRYKRQDVVSRIVNAYPDAVWTRPPAVVDHDALAKALLTLDKEVSLFHYINRADRLAGIGKYSVLFFGFGDVTNDLDLMKPVTEGTENLTLNYVQAYGYGAARVTKYVTDPSSPQFGLPEAYELTTRDSATATRKINVHYTRVLHIADCALDDEVNGYPIIERVFNRLDDLEKVVGGSSEVFWLGSRKGMQIDIDKDSQFTEADAAKLSDEVDEYVHDLRRIIRTRGVNIKELGGNGVNPEPVFNVIMSMISVTTGIPQRIFIGSEQGKLASEQDRANWAVRIDERRRLFAEPKILVPMISRLQEYGVLPKGVYSMEWPEAFRLSPLERAQTAAQQARSATNLARAATEQPDLMSVQEARSIIFSRGELKGEGKIDGVYD